MSAPETIRIGREREFLALSDNYENAPTRSVGGELWGFRARLRVQNLEASALVTLTGEESEAFPAFFEQLAAGWRGWPGALEWRSGEGNLVLACTNEGHGVASLATELTDEVRGWVVHAVVPVDAGQLAPLARDLGRFF